MSEYKDNPVAMPTLGDYYNALQGLEDAGDVMSRQVAGSHYKRAIQPWEIIDEWELCYYSGNVLKYLLRYKYKNGVEDLEKAKHYLEYLIKKEKDALITARD
jgi:hypothetical protein